VSAVFRHLVPYLLSQYAIFRERLRGAWSIHLQPGLVVNRGSLRLGPRAILQVNTGGVLEVQGAIFADRDVEIVVYKGGKLIIGENVYIGHYSTIACACSITIDRNCMLADFVSIRDMNHRRQPGKAIAESGIETRSIVIGMNCWLGSKVTVVAGAVLENDVTVGANAVVTGHIPSGATAVGVPARVLPQTEARERNR